MNLVHVICDYGPGDLAFAEIISALGAVLPMGWIYRETSIPSFDTLSTGFIVGQLGLQKKSLRPHSMIVYANCAPRKDKPDEARKKNEGEGLLYGKLRNGVSLLVVNSGYSLSFVKKELTDLRTVKVDNTGSQFRSRDVFPPVVGKLAGGDLSFCLKKLDASKIIRDIPENVVAYVDSFGNIKTTIRASTAWVKKLKPGAHLRVKINGVPRTLIYARGSFEVNEGEFAFAPGSSGQEDPFMEIFQRGGSASQDFRNVQSHAKIDFRKLP